MSSQLTDLLKTLSPAQQSAIAIIKLSLDCFNNADGSGLFSGIERYQVLTARVEISAVQADSLPRFWALLLKRMLWHVPQKSFDDRVLECIAATNPNDVLRVLATETASVITLARMGHDQTKLAKKELAAEQKNILSQPEDDFGALE